MLRAVKIESYKNDKITENLSTFVEEWKDDD